jgi:tetratricopeptide (TPR) repeat protein
MPDEELPPVPPPPLAEEPPLPGKEAGGFRPLEPDNRERARQPVPAGPPKDEPRKPIEPPPPDRLMPRLPVNPDPRVESLRQIELGKGAFARQEYGQATERFRQAAELAPANALPQFLLAQAHLALGNHRRAFDALLIGLRHQPDWPTQPFRPIELYDDNQGDYAEDLRLLDNLLNTFPDDPVLQFLSAYQLWFDGRRDEARPLFEKAAPALPDPSIVDRFLQALPSSDII